MGISVETSGGSVDSYKELPLVYLAAVIIWACSGASWTLNTYINRRFQPNKLQRMLGSVPWIKTLQLSLSFLFWYSCFYYDSCSLWMSFGVYITGVLFHTSCFVSFILISHGYCITCQRLSLSERRKMAALASILYFTLVGYRASLPYFSVLLLLNYAIVFYVILSRISQNLIVLRDQLSLIEDENVQMMHDAVYTKYIMFKKFRCAMHVVALLELAVLIHADGAPESYWIRLLVREWAQFLIFIYIGWIFRSQELVPRFSVMPILRSTSETKAPPIYSIEMDAESFRALTSHEWYIGVPTLPQKGSLKDSVVVIIRQPNARGENSASTFKGDSSI